MFCTSKTVSTNSTDSIRFVLKFVFVAISLLLALRVLGAFFASSRLTGLVAVVLIAGVLYLTAARWRNWLAGLLLFCVMNSLIGPMRPFRQASLVYCCFSMVSVQSHPTSMILRDSPFWTDVPCWYIWRV
jgi:hypothetical protein